MGWKLGDPLFSFCFRCWTLYERDKDHAAPFGLRCVSSPNNTGRSVCFGYKECQKCKSVLNCQRRGDKLVCRSDYPHARECGPVFDQNGDEVDVYCACGCSGYGDYCTDDSPVKNKTDP